MPSDRLIVALDYDDPQKALTLVDQLAPYLSFYKVGKQLFTLCGPDFVRELRRKGVDVFLDLKFHDIPQTVSKAVKSAVSLDVRFLTIHASGGSEMMRAAAEAVKGTKTQVLAVTVLTSFDEESLKQIGVDHTVPGQVLNLARLAATSGIQGLVCSPFEVELIRGQIKTPMTLVTPGIRGPNDPLGDQKRTLSAKEAIQAGANYLVVGRPVTQAADPVASAKALIESIG